MGENCFYRGFAVSYHIGYVMRIINRANVTWFVFTCLATVAAIILYLANFHPNDLSGVRLPSFLVQKPSVHRSVGGTPLGLIFGTISFAIFIFAVLLSLRKKIPLWPVGSVQRWLRAHIWLTLLTIPLVALHSGFRFGGPMTTLLMVLYAIVMISGIYGLILQHQLPALMKERLPGETVFEQIPYIRGQLVTAAVKMRDSLEHSPAARLEAVAIANASTGSTAADFDEKGADTVAALDPDSESLLIEFLDRQVIPYLSAKRGEGHSLGKPRFSEDTFRFVRLRLAEVYRERVDQIQTWCNERRRLDLQTKMQHWLHGWLFVHVPFSFLLVLLTAWHAFVTLFYY